MYVFSGWIEVRRRLWPGWVAVVNLHHVIDNSTSLNYGPLFGLRAMGAPKEAFSPIADRRGFPDDLSEGMRREVEEAQAEDPGGGVLSPSWVLWSELKAINWDEESADHWVIGYQRLSDGTERRMGRAAQPSAPTPDLLEAFVHPEAQPLGRQWEMAEGAIYRVEHPRRRDTVSDDWWVAFALMERLAARFGDDGVRAVVFFSF